MLRCATKSWGINPIFGYNGKTMSVTSLPNEFGSKMTKNYCKMVIFSIKFCFVSCKTLVYKKKLAEGQVKDGRRVIEILNLKCIGIKY